MKTLIIIPAYNEAEHIAQVVGEIKAAAPQADCLVVNDCSRDATQQVCMERGLSFVSLPLNLGIGGGVQTGYLYAWTGAMTSLFRWTGTASMTQPIWKSLSPPSSREMCIRDSRMTALFE